MNSASPNSLLTLKEVAELLKVHTETLRRWDRIGKLSAVKVSTRGDRRYRLSDIQAIIEESISKEIIQSPDTYTTEDFYISPHVRVFDNFRDAESERIEMGDLYLPEKTTNPLDSSFIFTRSFVIAEPGLGKSRLMYEICKVASNLGKISILIDLKKFADSRVVFLEEYIKTINPGLKETKFHSLSSDTIIFCLDSLDEIRTDEFSGTVEKIKAFARSYPQLSIMITSRWYFFKNHKDLFSNFDFNYAVIKPFNMENILAYLDQKGISNKEVGRLLEILHISGRELVVRVPRYLELLATYVKAKGIANITNLNRADLFEHFIYKKLDLEDKRLNSQNKESIKRALEMLALTMEIYQANLITTDELQTFFGDIEGLSQFVKDLPLEIFYEKSLLKKNDNLIEFDNAEFQEYLAAKQILRLGRSLYTVFNLAVEPELREIQPSWFSTLSFLIDMEPSLLKPLLEFRKGGKVSFVQMEQYHILLTKVNLNKISLEDRKAIFERVFTYYQKILNWIDWDIARNLSYYFDNSQIGLLKQYVEKTSFSSNTRRIVQLANVTQIVGFLISHEIFNDQELQYWRRKLIDFAKDDSDNGVVQRHSMFALECLNDPSVIKEVEIVWKHPEGLVREQFIDLCSKIDPNSDISIKYFVEALKRNMLEVYQGIYSISTTKALINFLKLLMADERALESFLDRSEGLFENRSKKIIAIFERLWSEDLKDTLEKFIRTAFELEYGYKAEKSELLQQLAILLQQKDSRYPLSLIGSIKKSVKLKENIFAFENIFAAILQKAQVAKSVEMLKTVEHGGWLIFRALQDIKFSKREDAEEVFEEGRQFFIKEYQEAEKRWNLPSEKDTQELKRYEDFKHKLQPEPGQFMSDLFEFYLENQQIIEKHWNEQDKERLLDILKNSVFSKFDPAEHKLRITQVSDGSTTYTTHSWIHIFGDCIKVAHYLKMDISKYRERIISYIPFAYTSHLQTIFNLVDNLTNKEVKRLIKVYLDKESDLWRHQPDNLAEAAKKFKLLDAIPVLKEFVDQNTFRIYERINALEAIDTINPNVNYLEQVRTKYEKSNSELTDKTEEFLIQNHGYEIAIKSRFDNLKKRAFTYKEVEGTHSVGPLEEELHSRKYAAPLLSLKDPKFEPLVLDLLDYSFDLISKDKTYWSYATYLWEIIYKYYDNRKEEGGYEPLKTLEDHLQLNLRREGVNWFIGKLKDLRRSYMIFIGRPSSFMEAVGTYNNLKKQQYLQIANNQDLLQEVKNVINGEILDFIKAEGSALLKSGETNIQKQLITQIENVFLRHGFSGKKQVIILRESQAIDDTRCDFLIYYGFLGPILIELKLSEHKDLQGDRLNEKESFQSFKNYISNYKSEYSIFLVLENKNRSSKGLSWKDHFIKIKGAYGQIPNVQVLGLPS